ncbi:hypothetical protein AHAS_Ahas18G0225100 [Arachis hypogaea]
MSTTVDTSAAVAVEGGCRWCQLELCCRWVEERRLVGAAGGVALTLLHHCHALVFLVFRSWSSPLNCTPLVEPLMSNTTVLLSSPSIMIIVFFV